MQNKQLTYKEQIEIIRKEIKFYTQCLDIVHRFEEVKTLNSDLEEITKKFDINLAAKLVSFCKNILKDLNEYNKMQAEALAIVYSHGGVDIQKNQDYKNYLNEINQLDSKSVNQEKGIQFECEKNKIISKYLEKAKQYASQVNQLDERKTQLDVSIKNNEKIIFQKTYEAVDPYLYECEEYRLKKDALNESHTDINSVAYKEACDNLSIKYKDLIEQRRQSVIKIFCTKESGHTVIVEENLSDQLINAFTTAEKLLHFFQRVVETYREYRLRDLGGNDNLDGFRENAVDSLLDALQAKALLFLQHEKHALHFSKVVSSMTEILQKNNLDTNDSFKAKIETLSQTENFFKKVKGLDRRIINALSRVDGLIKSLADPQVVVFLTETGAQRILNLQEKGIVLSPIHLKWIQDQSIGVFFDDVTLMRAITASTIELNQSTNQILIAARKKNITLTVESLNLIQHAHQCDLTHEDVMTLIQYQDVIAYHAKYAEQMTSEDFQMILMLKAYLGHNYPINDSTMEWLKKLKTNSHYAKAVRRIFDLFRQYNARFGDHQLRQDNLRTVTEGLLNATDDQIKAYHNYTQYVDFAHVDCLLKKRDEVQDLASSEQTVMQKKKRAIQMIYDEKESKLYLYDARFTNKLEIVLNPTQQEFIKTQFPEQTIDVTLNQEQLNKFIEKIGIAPHLFNSIVAHHKVMEHIKGNPTLQKLLADETHISEKIMFVHYLVGDWADCHEKNQNNFFDGQDGEVQAIDQDVLNLIVKVKDLPRAAQLFQEIAPIFSHMMIIQFEPESHMSPRQKQKKMLKEVMMILLNNDKDEMKCIKLSYVAEKHFGVNRNAFTAWIRQVFAKIACTFSASTVEKRAEKISACKETLFVVKENIVKIQNDLVTAVSHK